MSEQNTPPKKDNKGYLFVNHNKNKPTQPDQTGRIVIDGKEYRISAWDSVTNDGRGYLSLAVTPYFPPNNTPGNNNQQSHNSNQQNSSNKNTPNGNSNSNYGGSKNFTAAPISNDFDLDLDEILNQTDDDPF